MFEKEIEEELRRLHGDGMTYQEISKKTGVSVSSIAGVINGRQPLKNPSCDLLLKVFPRAVVRLEGGAAVANGGSVAVNNSGSNNNFFTPPETDRLRRIIDAVMSSDLSADAKVKVYQIVTQTGKDPAK